MTASILLMVSKVDGEDEKTISSKIKGIVHSNKNISTTARIVLLDLLKENRVALFSKRTDKYELESILRKVDETKEYTLDRDGSLSLSDGAKLEFSKLTSRVIDDMHFEVREVCQYLENRYNSPEGSIPAIEGNVVLIREAKNILKTEGGSLKSFEDFADKVNLRSSIKNSVSVTY